LRTNILNNKWKEETAEMKSCTNQKRISPIRSQDILKTQKVILKKNKNFNTPG
jgi:hypothetical protein